MRVVDAAQRCHRPADLLIPVIERDMWPTGVDAPSLCSMYAGKPMRGKAPNNSMQLTALRAAADAGR